MFEKRNTTEPNHFSATAQSPQPQPLAPADEVKRRAKAVIGQGISVSGDVSGNEDLSIEGKVDGTINLRDNVVNITHSGEVRANVTASTVNISGRVVGDVVGIEQVVLTKSAWVRGNIIAPRVNLENGSKFKGSIDMEPAEEKAALKPKADERRSSPRSSERNAGTAAATTEAASSTNGKEAPIKRTLHCPQESAART